MKHIKSFKVFEGDSFTQFMQQAQVAQSGNPYWFGRNPKLKKRKPVREDAAFEAVPEIETILARYEKSYRLFQLGLIDHIAQVGSTMWNDLMSLIKHGLADAGYLVDWSEPVGRDYVKLEVRRPEQKVGKNELLRSMLMPNKDRADEIILISAGYLKSLPIAKPLEVVAELLKLADRNL